MSPTPLIELQRRLAEAGRIRMGEKTEKGAPKRLTTWRITSPTKDLIEQAAGLYGGKPEPWESTTGPQWEVVTTASELPVLVMPAYSLRQSYEFRTSPTLVERRCDGHEMDDGRPCLCNADGLVGDAACKLITRLTVALPELTTMLGWRLESKGENAARELLASMDLVQGVAPGRPFVPARLRIVERRGNVDGQAVRYVVPVIDVSMRYSEVLGGELTPRERAALPAGYVPIERTNGGVSLEEGLSAAEKSGKPKATSGRQAAPIPESEDFEFGGTPVPVDEPEAASFPSSSEGDTPSSPEDQAPVAASGSQKPTKRQLEKLNVLVGTLRESGHINTMQLYSALANSRNIDVTVMTDVLEGAYTPDGVLHWSPLRDSLIRAEASDLIDRLEKLEANVGATA